jgi:predicted Zn finger-like uncharacterized protein
MITFSCPKCQKAFRVKDEYAGKTTRCPSCSTTLTVPKSAPSNVPGNRQRSTAEGSSRPWSGGDRVLAHWPKERQEYDEEPWWYTGTVVEVQAERIRVLFDDGDQSWLISEQVRSVDIKPGSRVFGRWKQGHTFFPGTASVVEGERLHIQYDDGDQEWTTFRWIRVDRGVPPSLLARPKLGPGSSPDGSRYGAAVPFAQAHAASDKVVQVLLFIGAMAVWAIGAIWISMELGKEAGIIWNLVCLAAAWGCYLYRQSTVCPKCGRPWSRVYLGSKLIDRVGSFQTVTRKDEHKDSRGQVYATTERQEQVHMVHESFLDSYRCKNCRHEWTGTSSRQREG